MWSCFTIPIELAFQPPFLEQYANNILNTVIDVVYILDIFINFRTTIRNVLTGEEIVNSKIIAINYLKGRFFIDLVSAAPMDLLFGE